MSLATSINLVATPLDFHQVSHIHAKGKKLNWISTVLNRDSLGWLESWDAFPANAIFQTEKYYPHMKMPTDCKEPKLQNFPTVNTGNFGNNNFYKNWASISLSPGVSISSLKRLEVNHSAINKCLACVVFHPLGGYFWPWWTSQHKNSKDEEPWPVHLDSPLGWWHTVIHSSSKGAFSYYTPV